MSKRQVKELIIPLANTKVQGGNLNTLDSNGNNPQGEYASILAHAIEFLRLKKMGKYGKQLNTQRHEFLLTFFADQEEDKYAKRIVNGYTIIKQWNGTSNRWEVAIHPPKTESPCSELSNEEHTVKKETDGLPF